MTIITQDVTDIEGVDDNTSWTFYVKELRLSDAGDTIVTTKKVRKYPVAGVLTVELDPGPAVVTAPDGKTYPFTVPDADSELWPLIEAGVTIPPSGTHQQLVDAVEDWLARNFDAATGSLDTLGAVSDSDFRLDDDRTPIDGSVSTPKLDATLQAGLGNLGGLGSPNFVTTTAHVLNANNNTTSTLKTNGYGVPHYNNAEEPVVGLHVAADTSTNTVRIGGGTSDGNAATKVELYTAATNTTTTGTLQTTVDTAGFLDHRARMRVRGDASGSSALDVGSDTAAAQFLRFNTAAGNARDMQFASAGVRRWAIRAEATAESGSDAGSDLQIISYTDAGSTKTTVVNISRATGAITLAGLLATLASATGTAGFRLPHGAAPTSPVDGDVWTTTAGMFARINGATIQLNTTAPVTPVANTSQTVISNTTTETTIVTKTLPTGALVVGSTYRIAIKGKIQFAATSGTLSIKPYIGATGGAAAVIPSQGSAAGPVSFQMEVDMTVRTTGGSGTYMPQGAGLLPVGGWYTLDCGGGVVTVDTTAATPVVKLTAQWATASASNILTVETATIVPVV